MRTVYYYSNPTRPRRSHKFRVLQAWPVTVMVVLYGVLALLGCHETERTFEAQPPKHYAVEQNAAAIEAMQAGDIEAALEFAQSAVAHDPEFAAFYINKAVILARMGDLPSALETLDRCLKVEGRHDVSDLAQVYLLRGIFLENTDRMPEARAAYAEAIALVDLEEVIDDGDVNLAIQVAIAQYLRGGAVGGLKSLNSVLNAFPDNRPARMAKVRMLANDRQYFMRWATSPIALENNEGEADTGSAVVQNEDSLLIQAP